MRARGGGRPGDEQPDLDHLDLDQPAGADAEVVELFRAGLRPGAAAPSDLRAIERRAKRKHRRAQAVTSGVLAAAAALAAVLVVVSPAHGGGQGVPAVPRPSPTEAPRSPGRVAQGSLLPARDLSLTADQTGLVPGDRQFQVVGKVEDLSDELVVDRFCGGPALPEDAPSVGWMRGWESTETEAPADYTVNEQVLQWPGHPERASAVLGALRSQDYCSQGYGYEASDSTQKIGDDLAATVPVMVRHVATGDGRQKGQAVAMWDDTVVIVDLSGPDSATRSGAGESAGEVAVHLLGIAVNRLAGVEQAAPPWSAPSLSTDVPTRTGDGP